MDILGSLLDRINRSEEEDVDELDDRTPEEIDADEKKARIKFHRERVRNGPVRFASVTAGQIRRAEARQMRSQARKATRRHRRSWLTAQQRQATLRGQLQVAGLVPLHDGSWHNVDRGMVAHIERTYGSCEVALEIWDEVQDRNAKAAKRVETQRVMADMAADPNYLANRKADA